VLVHRAWMSSRVRAASVCACDFCRKMANAGVLPGSLYALGALLGFLIPNLACQGNDRSAATRASQLGAQGARIAREAARYLDLFCGNHPAREQHLIEIHELTHSLEIT